MSSLLIRGLLAGALGTGTRPCKPPLLPFWDALTLAFQRKWCSAGAATNFSLSGLPAMCSVRNAWAACGMQSVIFPPRSNLWLCCHTRQCGAVTEAVHLYLEPRRYLEIATDYAIRSIEDQILVAVRVAAMSMEMLYGLEVMRNPECQAALLEAAVTLNAAWSAYCLRQEFRTQLP